MGKRKAAKMALLKAGDTGAMRRQIVELNTTVNNLITLLNRETEKTTVLTAELKALKTTSADKTTKKTTKSKTSKNKPITEAIAEE